ncbi:MAG: hypothetical protein QM503_12455 [Bacteroidota bacterium]
MKKVNKILLLLVVVLLFSNCKKEEESWGPCIDCDLSEWAGSFEGTGVYYQESDSSSVLDVPTEITIENTSDTRLKVIVDAGLYFSSTTFIYKTNDDYFIELAGSNSSISLTLYQKNNNYKLSGTSKRYHYNVDTVLVIDQSLSFETFKINLKSY